MGEGDEAISRGTVRIDLAYGFVDQTRKLSGGRGADEVLVPKIDFENRRIEPDHHREIRTQTTQVKLDVAYALTGRLTLLAGLPLYNDRYHEHFDDAGTPDEQFTKTDGTSGFGDVQLGARAVLSVGAKNLLLGGVMLKVPTGAYKLLDSEGEINEPTIQPGTGSYDVIGSVSWSHHPFPFQFEWFASGSYRRNGNNDLDYQIGDEAIVSGGLNHSAAEKFGWSVQVNMRHAARDRYRGEKVSSTGADTVNLTPGVRLKAFSNTSLYTYLQIPIHQKVNEEQLAPRYGLVAGLTRTF